jgi:spore germination protein GerM
MNDFSDDTKYTSTGTLRSSHLIIIAAAAIIVGGLLYYFYMKNRGEGPARESMERVAPVEEGSRAVTLYFANRDDEALVAETRLVAIGKEYVDQIAQVIRALLSGPQGEGVNTIAEGTQLLNAFYDYDTATLYLDFTSEIVSGHPGGSSAEYYTIAAVMRTVSQNFPEVKAVQFLVEGLQVGTIGGHIDAYNPFFTSDWR